MTAAPAAGQAKILIVNADDFGLTAGVSRGILEAHRHGIVTSTTLLVNREIPPALIEELAASDLGVGVHLNLTLGSPVASAKRVPSLVDAEGRFIRDAREAAARANVDEARIELGTQIDAFRTIMGRFPTHLDSHHHVGRHSPILDLVLDFARAGFGCCIIERNSATEAVLGVFQPGSCFFDITEKVCSPATSTRTSPTAATASSGRRRWPGSPAPR